VTGYATPRCFIPSSVRKRLKDKEIANPLDPNVRKRNEAKDLGYFVVGRCVVGCREACGERRRCGDRARIYSSYTVDKQFIKASNPLAKPAPGAPSDSKTHPCNNQAPQGGAASVSLYFGDRCCIAGVQRDLEE
jgi:hypothetical protein